VPLERRESIIHRFRTVNRRESVQSAVPDFALFVPFVVEKHIAPFRWFAYFAVGRLFLVTRKAL